MKHGKKYQDSTKLVDTTVLYDTTEAIENCLKTAKAKATHWNRYLNTLKEYEDQYSMNPDSEYPEVLEQVKGELDKLDLSTSVPPPEA